MTALNRDTMRLSLTALAAMLVGLALYPTNLLHAGADFAPGGRPSWLTELSATGRTGYDTNVYGVDNAREGEPIANHGAWTGSLGVRCAVSLSALLESPKDYLQVGYAPTAHWFRGAADENHTQHRFSLQSTGRRGDWSWSLDNATTWVDGSKDSLRFKAYNIFGMALVRDRRAQVQETGRAWVRYDGPGWFVRGAAAAQVNDYHTNLRAPVGADAGWVNWVDRSDLNGGLDLGWKAGPATSVHLGYRLGTQHQDTAPWMPKSSSNHYTRALVGIESRPVKGLTCSLQAGPDFRRYASATQYLTDRTPVAWHYVGNVTAALSKADTLTLAAKQERWLSSTGQSAYDARTISLAWHHGFSTAWSLQLSGQLQQGKYPAPVVRDDVVQGGLAQLRWRATKQVEITLDAAVQVGGDRVDLPATAGRGFRRTVVGLALHTSR